MLATRGLGRKLTTGLLLATAGLGFGKQLVIPDTGQDVPTTVEFVLDSATNVKLISDGAVVVVTDTDTVEPVHLDAATVEVSEETDTVIVDAGATTVTGVNLEQCNEVAFVDVGSTLADVLPSEDARVRIEIPVDGTTVEASDETTTRIV